MSGVTHSFLLKRSQIEIDSLGAQNRGWVMHQARSLQADRARALLLSFAISHNAHDFCRFLTVVALREFGAISATMIRVEQDQSLRTVGQYGQPRIEFDGAETFSESARTLKLAIQSNDMAWADVLAPATDKPMSFLAIPFSPSGETLGALGLFFRRATDAVLIPSAELELMQLLSELIAVNSLPRMRASGLLSKIYFDADSLEEISAISPRQLQILDEMAVGKTNAQIATALSVSESTVKQESVRIFKILGVNSRQRAVSVGKEMGII